MKAGRNFLLLGERLQNNKFINKTTKIFWPVMVKPQNATIKNTEALSRSQKLMTEMGLIKPASNGTFQIMPLAQRAIDKCVNLVNTHMHAVEGQKITLPVLTSAKLWEKSGRLHGNDIGEFYIVRDRHDKEFLLSPTHEEAVTAMLASAAPISYRQMPLRLYQVGPKFRDELKARFGLLRAKEFLMKDMYTFDCTHSEARETYEQLNVQYERFLKCLAVPFVKVEANAGMMGGSLSHEYHYLTDTGEDRLLLCRNCKHSTNAEVNESLLNCPRCKHETLEELHGIEVAHAFLLGDKYSKPLGATFLDEKGKPQPLIMGCFGIGISRIVAAALEVLSTEHELRWPLLLAPYDICIIGPKQGSKEQQHGDIVEAELCRSLLEICNVDDLLLDDRKSLTIGKRLMDAKRMGYPIIIVIGAKSALPIPKIELHIGDSTLDLELHEILTEIKKYNIKKSTLLTY